MVMLYVIALVFGAVQPAFDTTGAINHGIGGWASDSHDGIMQGRGFVLVFFVIALFVGYLLPELQREDATQYKKKER